MRRIILLFITILFLFSCKEKQQLTSSKITNQTNFVYDYSEIFTKNEIDSLNSKISKYEMQSTNEIVVVTKDSISGDVLQYATNLANEMGVGKKDKDNGLLILLSKKPRHVRITTGYGTEKILTDSICNDIINKQMIPEFKKDNFYMGINASLDEIILKWKKND